MRKLVFLEDDPVQSEWLTEELREEFPDALIELITSEFAFRERIEAFKSSGPDAFILDVMVRWTKPSAEIEDPPIDAKIGGYYRAGIRCAELLRAQGINSPILLYTILENNDISADIQRLKEAKIKDVSYVRKESDPRELFKAIRNRISGAMV